MPGIVTNEGVNVIFEVMYNQDVTDRSANLILGLFINTSGLDATTTWASSDITQPTLTGYAEKTLTDASWTVSGGIASYAIQEWTAGADWTDEDVTGYYIRTQGTTPRLVYIEMSGFSQVVANTFKYKVTPNITMSSGTVGITCLEGLDILMTSFFKRVLHTADSIKLYPIGDTTAFDEDTVFASVVPVTGGGSTAKTISDSTWSVASKNTALAIQTWTASADWSAPVYGIATSVTKSAVEYLVSIDNFSTAYTILDTYLLQHDLSNITD